MTTPLLRRALIVALEAGLALTLLTCVFFQAIAVPTALADEALLDPVVARAQGPLTVIAILGIACFEAVLIATGMLLRHTWNDSIFSHRPFIWVDVTIGACLVAAGLSLAAALTDIVAPNIPASAIPDGMETTTGTALLIFGMAGTAACIAGALVVAVMRDLLKRAVTIRRELDEVI
ncbi:DUF2975 domain-containing protein [Brachybacterium sp. FME24]|uniref:DUF2975 domain-containing protein n=1 Tax=Brachybacterium sp. FME24 TaxID=2742605 RepID=UPI001866561B|nr:DUF2975 domain-containing protein [Brachybacterium sp. FME24]